MAATGLSTAGVADAVEHYCHDAGIHLATLQPETSSVEPRGLDITS
jgi:hypothetical protein